MVFESIPGDLSVRFSYMNIFHIKTHTRQTNLGLKRGKLVIFDVEFPDIFFPFFNTPLTEALAILPLCVNNTMQIKLAYRAWVTCDPTCADSSPLYILFCFSYLQLLSKSASVRGFLLFHYAEEFKSTLAKLVDLYDSGKLKCHIDVGHSSPTGVFKGLDSIPDAVEVGIKMNILGIRELIFIVRDR